MLATRKKTIPAETRTTTTVNTDIMNAFSPAILYISLRSLLFFKSRFFFVITEVKRLFFIEVYTGNFKIGISKH